MLVTPRAHLVLVLLSDAVQLSPVLVPQLLQLPLVILLHFVTHFLQDVGQLRVDKGWKARHEKRSKLRPRESH